jgi:hypothetical protein
LSHITSVAIPIKDIAVAKRALEALGMDVHEGGTVEVYDGSTVTGDLTVRTPGTAWSRQKDYGIAFTQTEDGLEASADWGAVTGHETMRRFGSQQVFLDAVGQKYSELLVRDEMTLQGFTLEESEVEGKIVLVGKRYR